MNVHIDIVKLWEQLWEQECYVAPLDEDDRGPDDHEFVLHIDYSGRGMYGRKCIGLEGRSLAAAAHLAAAVAAVLDIAIGEVASELTIDALGTNNIVYLPDYQGIDTRTRA